MFINARPVLSILDMYRLIWISGRFGGHKTALAYKIAQDYLDQGYRLISNSVSVWADNIDQEKTKEQGHSVFDFTKVDLEESGHLHAVVLLDEGGLYFKSSKQIEAIAAYAAKMDCIYLIPSFFPPTKTATIVNIQAAISLKSAGIPVVIYKWSVNLGSFKDKGWFAWFNPAEIYGIYSRQDPGADPQYLIQFLIEKMEKFRSRYGHEANNLLQMEEVESADIISDAISNFAESVDDLASIQARNNRRRR